MEILAPPLPARRALDRARRSRDPRFDGRFFVGVTHDRHLLPAGVPGAEPARRERALLPDRRRRGRGRLPAVPALPARGRARHAGLARHLGRRRRALRARSHEGALDERRRGRARRPARHRRRATCTACSWRTSARRRSRSRRRAALHFAKRLIDETDLPMTEIAFASGFGSVRRFNDAFRTTYDRAPSALRRLRPRDGAPAGGETSCASRSARPTTRPACSRSSRRARFPASSAWTSGATRRTLALASGAPPWCRCERCPAGTRCLLRVAGRAARARSSSSTTDAAARVRPRRGPGR